MMSRTLKDCFAAALIILAVALGFLHASAWGGTVISQLGEQDFADGQSPVYSRQIREAGAGEAYPFNGSIFGNDMKRGSLGAFEYTHGFDLAGCDVISAMLTVGLIDHDSTASQPIDALSLRLNGVGQSTAPFVGRSSNAAPSSVSVVTVPVDASLLMQGELFVQFAAIAPSPLGIGNAIEIDFSTLLIETKSSGVIATPGQTTPNPPPADSPIDPSNPPAPGAGTDGGTPIPLPPAVWSAGALMIWVVRMKGKRARNLSI